MRGSASTLLIGSLAFAIFCSEPLSHSLGAILPAADELVGAQRPQANGASIAEHDGAGDVFFICCKRPESISAKDYIPAVGQELPRVVKVAEFPCGGLIASDGVSRADLALSILGVRLRN